MNYLVPQRSVVIKKYFAIVLTTSFPMTEAQNSTSDNPEVDAIWEAMQQYNHSTLEPHDSWYLVNANNGYTCRETPEGLNPLQVAESIPGLSIVDSSQSSLPDGANIFRIQVELDGESGVLEFTSMHGSCLALVDQNSKSSDVSTDRAEHQTDYENGNGCTVITTGYIAGEAAFGFSPISALDSLLEAESPGHARDILESLPFTWNSGAILPYCNGIDYVENVAIEVLPVSEEMLRSHGNSLMNYYYGVAELFLGNGNFGSCTVFAPKVTSSQCIEK